MFRSDSSIKYLLHLFETQKLLYIFEVVDTTYQWILLIEYLIDPIEFLKYVPCVDNLDVVD